MHDDARPVPDTKDWTWVLDRRCPDCGFDAGAIDRDDFAGQVRRLAARWRDVLTSGHPRLAERPPAPPERGAIWSAQEYGAHVRDVFELGAYRLQLMLTEDDPAFRNWNPDDTADESDYRAEDPGQQSYQLAVQAGEVADLLDKVHGEQWERTGRRSDGAVFTVESFARYLLHDPVHHLWDVEQGYEALSTT